MDSIKKRSYYFKLLGSLLVVVLVSVLILAVSFFSIFTRALEDKLYAEYHQGLARSRQAFEYILNETAQLHRSILADPKAEIFITASRYIPRAEYLAFLSVNKIVLGSPYLSSVCLYNVDNGSWFETGSRNGFNPEETANGLVPRQRRSLLTWQNDTVSHFIIVFSLPTEDEYGYHVFYAMDAMETAQRVWGESSALNAVLDANGNVLLQLDTGETQVPAEQYAPIAMENKETRGTIPFTYEGKRYVLLTQRDQETGTVFLGIHPYEEVVGSLSQQRNTIILIAALVAMGLSILSVLLGRRLYGPLRKVAQVFESSRYAGPSHSGEFELISDVYEKVISDNRNLQQQNDSSLPRLRTDYLRRLITPDAYYGAEPGFFEQKAKEYGFAFDFGRFYLASMHIDRYLDDPAPEEAAIINAQVNSHLKGSLSEQYMVELAPDSFGGTAIFISAPEGIEEVEERELLVKELQKVRDDIIKDCPVAITVALGGVCSDFTECSGKYQKARELVAHNFILGYNHVITSATVLRLAPEAIVYPDRVMNDILEALRLGKKDRYIRRLDGFIETICGYTLATARLLYVQLSLECTKELQQISAGVKGIAQEVAPSLLSPSILEEGRDQLLVLYDQYQSAKVKIAELKNDKHYKVVSEVVAYIEQEYSDPSLSTELLAEKFGYSANYFAKMFKSITNSFLNDYIKQIRISKAQALITGTNLSVSEISAQVGFSNPNYFYSLFKKETGLTPASYRGKESRKEGPPQDANAPDEQQFDAN